MHTVKVLKTIADDQDGHETEKVKLVIAVLDFVASIADIL